MRRRLLILAVSHTTMIVAVVQTVPAITTTRTVTRNGSRWLKRPVKTVSRSCTGLYATVRNGSVNSEWKMKHATVYRRWMAMKYDGLFHDAAVVRVCRVRPTFMRTLGLKEKAFQGRDAGSNHESICQSKVALIQSSFAIHERTTRSSFPCPQTQNTKHKKLIMMMKIPLPACSALTAAVLTLITMTTSASAVSLEWVARASLNDGLAAGGLDRGRAGIIPLPLPTKHTRFYSVGGRTRPWPPVTFSFTIQWTMFGRNWTCRI
jgi:hypothetical protein